MEEADKWTIVVNFGLPKRILFTSYPAPSHRALLQVVSEFGKQVQVGAVGYIFNPPSISATLCRVK